MLVIWDKTQPHGDNTWWRDETRKYRSEELRSASTLYNYVRATGDVAEPFAEIVALFLIFGDFLLPILRTVVETQDPQY
jgi:hypothetical protein